MNTIVLITAGILVALFILLLCFSAQDKLEEYRANAKVDKTGIPVTPILSAYDFGEELPPRHDEEETLRKKPIRDKSDEEVFAEVEQVIKTFEL